MVTLRLESARGKAFGFGVADVSPYRMKIKGVRRRDAGRGERTMFHVTNAELMLPRETLTPSTSIHTRAIQLSCVYRRHVETPSTSEVGTPPLHLRFSENPREGSQHPPMHLRPGTTRSQAAKVDSPSTRRAQADRGSVPSYLLLFPPRLPFASSGYFLQHLKTPPFSVGVYSCTRGLLGPKLFQHEALIHARRRWHGRDRAGALQRLSKSDG